MLPATGDRAHKRCTSCGRLLLAADIKRNVCGNCTAPPATVPLF